MKRLKIKSIPCSEAYKRRFICRVCINKTSGQRFITIPRKADWIGEGDFVEVRVAK